MSCFLPTIQQALLRPGRFDRHIMIDLPTLAEREEIFNVYLNKLTLAMPAEAYAKPLSRLTPGMSGKNTLQESQKNILTSEMLQKGMAKQNI